MNLMSKKGWFFALSLLIIIPGIISLILYGLNLGIDFTGGTLLEYQFNKIVSTDQVRNVVMSQGVEVSSAISSNNGQDVILKTKQLDGVKIAQIKANLQRMFGSTEEVRIESVGPIIGGETTTNSFIALILASIMIVLYLALAFRKVPHPASAWRFGVTAVVALVHDVLVLVGIFSILGHFFKIEIDVLFVTALLTVIGFSVHDTIVVFDRIRENLPKNLSKRFSQIADISIDQTLARSLNTSLTVIFVLLALLLFGGDTIKWFIVALLVGIVSGTYSSIFNATTLLVLWEEKLNH